MQRNITIVVFLLFFCVTAAAQAPLPDPIPLPGRVVEFDYPTAWYTQPSDINSRGLVVGVYAIDPPVGGTIETTYGFLRKPDGTLLPIDAPGADSTLLTGINDRNWIAGWGAIPGTDDGHNFIRYPGGHFRRVRLPGDHPLVRGIGDNGDLVGSYVDTADPYYIHGFIRDLRRRVVTIDVPGANRTWPMGINDRRQVVGRYREFSSIDRGFVWSRGRFRSIDIPDAVYTVASDINAHGEIVGWYATPPAAPGEPNRNHGFLIARDGAVYSIDIAADVRTRITGINDRGVIVGLTITADNNYHGFIFRR